MTRTEGEAGSNYDRLEDAVVHSLGKDELGQAVDVAQSNDSEERRNSFRCPVPTDQGNGLLIRKGKNLPYPVRLINQSAGGYSVTCQGKVKIRKREVLHLRTQSGLFEVQVVHVKRDGKQTQLGLVLLAEIIDFREPSSISLNTLFLVLVFASAFFFYMSMRQ
jgi:hypothetical protein